MSDGMFHELNTGDVTDDDWEVFDDALQQSPLPPEPAADTPVVNKAVEPPRPTRVIGSSYFNIASSFVYFNFFIFFINYFTHFKIPLLIIYTKYYKYLYNSIIHHFI